MKKPVDQIFQQETDRIKKSGLYRSLKKIGGPICNVVFIDGQEMILLSSNNYLGLANHPKLKQAAISALNKYGTSAGSSRLIAGNMEIHEKLEKKIAKFKECKSAIIFSSGYMANIGVITSLAGKGDLILSDELNHASIVDGCRLSGAEIKVYSNKDTNEIEAVLSQCSGKTALGKYKKKFIITDGVFSMNGHIAPLSRILELAEVYNAFVIVDDAHATGVLGEKGKGTAKYYGLNNDRIIQIGTFSKALGSLGGYAAGSEVIIDYIRNKSRSFIYSTALPPSVCAASIAAIDLLENDLHLKKRLWNNVESFRNKLEKFGFNTMQSQTQIIPILIGDTNLTMKFAKSLFIKGIYAPGVRPPTVPDNTSRIRVSLMASHTDMQINKALTVLENEGKKLSII